MSCTHDVTMSSCLIMGHCISQSQASFKYQASGAPDARPAYWQNFFFTGAAILTVERHQQLMLS